MIVVPPGHICWQNRFLGMIPGLLKRLKIRTLLWKGEWEGGVMPPSPPPPYFPADPWIFNLKTT